MARRRKMKDSQRKAMFAKMGKSRIIIRPDVIAKFEETPTGKSAKFIPTTSGNVKVTGYHIIDMSVLAEVGIVSGTEKKKDVEKTYLKFIEDLKTGKQTDWYGKNKYIKKKGYKFPDDKKWRPEFTTGPKPGYRKATNKKRYKIVPMITYEKALFNPNIRDWDNAYTPKKVRRS